MKKMYFTDEEGNVNPIIVRITLAGMLYMAGVLTGLLLVGSMFV